MRHLGLHNGADGCGNDGSENHVPLSKACEAQHNGEKGCEDCGNDVQPVRALGNKQGYEHAAQGVVKAKRANVAHHASAQGADNRSHHPGKLGTARGREDGGLVELPALLEGCNMHCKELVRYLPAIDEARKALQGADMGCQGHGHEEVAQVGDKDRQGSGDEACSCEPEGNGNELAGSCKHEDGGGCGKPDGHAALGGKHAKGKGHGRIAKHDGQGSCKANSYGLERFGGSGGVHVE